MLSTSAPVAFLATAMPDRARAFYADTLGLPVLSDDEFSVVFDMGGVPLRLQKVRELTPHPFTALGWQVGNAVEVAAALRARGVVFERYPFLQQDANDLWQAPGGARVAWFKDPDGNLLSITDVPR